MNTAVSKYAVALDINFAEYNYLKNTVCRCISTIHAE